MAYPVLFVGFLLVAPKGYYDWLLVHNEFYQSD